MKKLILICLVCALVMSGCTPKSQLYSLATDILNRVEAVCDEISGDVEKLDDEYTLGVFENIKKSIAGQKEILSDGPSRDEIEVAITTLSRLEKELGSIKILSGGMDDYKPELDLDVVDIYEGATE